MICVGSSVCGAQHWRRGRRWRAKRGCVGATGITRFKAVTSSSPLKYLKNIRLHKARMLMVNEGINASKAALKVGYESASQFSREFKRLFGNLFIEPHILVHIEN